jgi:hypothetical protein
MLNENHVPEWAKVKLAAVVGIASPWLAELLTKAGPVLDVVIKLGQIGVAAVTVLYIWTKWRNARKSKSQE